VDLETTLSFSEMKRLEMHRAFDILDTVPEEEFETIARLASKTCGTPIALVSLVDAERQWFKASVGLDIEEMPRDVTFCRYAIAQPGRVFVVPDAQSDECFSANPLVTGAPFIRFFAGVPLVTKEGQALGTVCVIDRVARSISPQQLDALTSVAKAAMAIIEQRRTIAELERARESQKCVEANLRSEIARRMEVEGQLRQALAHDCLTQLANRLQFMQKLDEALASLRRNPRRRGGFALLYIDLDRFKHLNDTFGHAAGDELLIEVARRLRKVVRSGDLVSRLGGDEFTILLRDVTVAAVAEELARRVEGAFHAPFRIAGADRFVTVSIGIVLADRRYRRPEDVLHDADIAMYESKANGRQRSSVFDDSLRQLSLLKATAELPKGSPDRRESAKASKPLRRRSSANAKSVRATSCNRCARRG
jgi:diguanylate cyclase (GGDEF)-like protein